MRLTFLCLLLVACYKSHGIEGDAGARPDVPFDAPAFDVPAFDVPGFDAPVVDVPVVDAGVEVGCRSIRLVAEARVPWPSVDCGIITFPRVAPLSGVEGVDAAFQLLITEFRTCRDRPARLLTRPVVFAGGSLQVGEESTIGNVEGTGNIASVGSEFAVCSGTTLHTGGFAEPEPLQMGCMNDALCAGLAHDGAGWGVGWRPGCDASAQVSRANPNGGQREEPITIDIRDSVASIAPSSDGFGALSVSPAALSLFHWPRSAPSPTYIAIDADRPHSEAALTAWPFIDGAWAVYSLEVSMLRMRVLSASGEVLIDQRYEVELPGYSAEYLRASSSPSGGAVVIAYSWAGGRVDSATRMLVFGRDGLPAGGEVGEDLVQDLGGADIAMAGRSILLHRAAPESSATDVLLYECF